VIRIFLNDESMVRLASALANREKRAVGAPTLPPDRTGGTTGTHLDPNQVLGRRIPRAGGETADKAARDPIAILRHSDSSVKRPGLPRS